MYKEIESKFEFQEIAITTILKKEQLFINLNNSYSYVVTNSNNKDVTKWFSKKKKRCNQMSKLLLQITISLPELLQHIYQTKSGVQ